MDMCVLRSRMDDRKSCTRTMPSYQPDTRTWSEPPQGLEGGATEIPYTAGDRSDACFLLGLRIANGFEARAECVIECTVRGAFGDDVPSATYGLDDLVDK